MMPHADLALAVIRRIAQDKGVVTDMDVSQVQAMLGVGKPKTATQRGVRAGQKARQLGKRAMNLPRDIVQAGQGFFQGLGGMPQQQVQPFTPQERARMLIQGNIRNFSQVPTPLPRGRIAPMPRMDNGWTDQFRRVPIPRMNLPNAPMPRRERPYPRGVVPRGGMPRPRARSGEARRKISDALRAQIVGNILGL
jgi:hypothetical protein